MIEIEKDEGVWVVTLNRPDKANALTPDMLGQLADTAEAAQDARALIVTGRGKVFSAGADLDAARSGMATSPDWERLSGAIAALPGLTIAALNGTAAGGAMGMVLACDKRLAVPAAKFFYPAKKLGFAPQPSDPPRLEALVGAARADLIFVEGQKITAPEALEWGLVDRICDDPLAEARALARQVVMEPRL